MGLNYNISNNKFIFEEKSMKFKNNENLLLSKNRFLESCVKNLQNKVLMLNKSFAKFLNNSKEVMKNSENEYKKMIESLIKSIHNINNKNLEFKNVIIGNQSIIQKLKKRIDILDQMKEIGNKSKIIEKNEKNEALKRVYETNKNLKLAVLKSHKIIDQYKSSFIRMKKSNISLKRFKDFQEKHKSTVLKKNNMINHLKKRISEIIKENDRFDLRNIEINKIKNENQKLKEIIDNFERELFKKKNKIRKLSDLLGKQNEITINSDYQEIINENNMLRSKIISVENQNKSIKNIVKSVKSELDKNIVMEDKVNMLSVELTRVKRELTDAQYKEQQSKTELELLKEKQIITEKKLQTILGDIKIELTNRLNKSLPI